LITSHAPLEVHRGMAVSRHPAMHELESFGNLQHAEQAGQFHMHMHNSCHASNGQP
jgi:hypothetical protein